MKATMDANGVITISAESSLEAFALRHWMDKATIPTDDQLRCIKSHWHTGWLKVDALTPEPPPNTKAIPA